MICDFAEFISLIGARVQLFEPRPNLLSDSMDACSECTELDTKAIGEPGPVPDGLTILSAVVSEKKTASLRAQAFQSPIQVLELLLASQLFKVLAGFY